MKYINQIIHLTGNIRKAALINQNQTTIRTENQRFLSGRSEEIWSIITQKAENNNSNKKKRIIILSYSIVKELNGWNLSEKAKNFKFSLRSFSYAKADCLNDYDKPYLKENPHDVIIHTVNNCVSNGGKSLKALVSSITKLSVSLKDDSSYVAISNIITWKDRWSDKVNEVNKHLAELREWKVFLLKKFQSKRII